VNTIEIVAAKQVPAAGGVLSPLEMVRGMDPLSAYAYKGADGVIHQNLATPAMAPMAIGFVGLPYDVPSCAASLDNLSAAKLVALRSDSY
jgi:hypothetical protein